MPLARLVSRAASSAGKSQAPAALASRSFYASAKAFAPKEMTVRDAINSALVSFRGAPRALYASAAGIRCNQVF